MTTNMMMVTIMITVHELLLMHFNSQIWYLCLCQLIGQHRGPNSWSLPCLFPLHHPFLHTHAHMAQSESLETPLSERQVKEQCSYVGGHSFSWIFIFTLSTHSILHSQFFPFVKGGTERTNQKDLCLLMPLGI